MAHFWHTNSRLPNAIYSNDDKKIEGWLGTNNSIFPSISNETSVAVPKRAINNQERKWKHLFDFVYTHTHLHKNNKTTTTVTTKTTCDAIVITFTYAWNIMLSYVWLITGQTVSAWQQKTTMRLVTEKKRSSSYISRIEWNPFDRTHFCNWCEWILHFFSPRSQSSYSWKMCSPSTQFDLDAAHKVTYQPGDTLHWCDNNDVTALWLWYMCMRAVAINHHLHTVACIHCNICTVCTQPTSVHLIFIICGYFLLLAPCFFVHFFVYHFDVIITSIIHSPPDPVTAPFLTDFQLTWVGYMPVPKVTAFSTVTTMTKQSKPPSNMHLSIAKTRFFFTFCPTLKKGAFSIHNFRCGILRSKNVKRDVIQPLTCIKTSYYIFATGTWLGWRNIYR